jgi:hypothetical protein
MIIYRVEHSINNVGMFQSLSHRSTLSDELYRVYRDEIYEVVMYIDNTPYQEAVQCGKESEYLTLKQNINNIMFGCLTLEELKEHWLPDFNNLINSLDKCGFVLAVYEVNHYVSLLTQVVFNKNYAKKQGEMSLRSLLELN